MEYLTAQTKELNTQIQGLEKKTKHSPDDLKAQVKSFIKESKAEIDALQKDIKTVEELSKEVADYLCEDFSKFKLENCLSELNAVIGEFETAKKVINH